MFAGVCDLVRCSACVPPFLFSLVLFLLFAPSVAATLLNLSWLRLCWHQMRRLAWWRTTSAWPQVRGLLFLRNSLLTRAPRLRHLSLQRPVVPGNGALPGGLVDAEWRAVSRFGDGFRVHLPLCPATCWCQQEAVQISGAHRSAGVGLGRTDGTFGHRTDDCGADDASARQRLAFWRCLDCEPERISSEPSAGGDGAKKHERRVRRAQKHEREQGIWKKRGARLAELRGQAYGDGLGGGVPWTRGTLDWLA